MSTFVAVLEYKDEIGAGDFLGTYEGKTSHDVIEEITEDWDLYSGEYDGSVINVYQVASNTNGVLRQSSKHIHQCGPHLMHTGETKVSDETLRATFQCQQCGKVYEKAYEEVETSRVG